MLRMKGIVSVAGSSERKVIQAVHEVYDIQDVPPHRKGESELNQLVLIGRNLNRQSLFDAFSQCLEDGQ